MTLRDRIMNLPKRTPGQIDIVLRAADMAKEADELMAEMAEALTTLLRVDDEWHGSVNSEMASARNKARAMIANYSTYKERNNEQ